MGNSAYIQELRANKRVPIVNLEIFDSLKMLKFHDTTLNHHGNTLEMYKEYLDKVLELTDAKQYIYLKAIEGMESVDNQVLENEDEFFINLYMMMGRESAYEYLLKNNFKLTKENFIEGHKKLLLGTSSEKFVDQDFRTDDDIYVGYIDKGQVVVDYLPISYTLIEEAIEKLLDFYHCDMFDEYLFFKAQIIHGLVAVLQIFHDGNSRYGRVLQNLKVGELTNKVLDYSFLSPPLYSTRAYIPFRYDYRTLIKKLAINPTIEQWNNWFNFNLNRVEDTMYLMEDKIKKFSKMNI